VWQIHPDVPVLQIEFLRHLEFDSRWRDYRFEGGPTVQYNFSTGAYRSRPPIERLVRFAFLEYVFRLGGDMNFKDTSRTRYLAKGIVAVLEERVLDLALQAVGQENYDGPNVQSWDVHPDLL